MCHLEKESAFELSLGAAFPFATAHTFCASQNGPRAFSSPEPQRFFFLIQIVEGVALGPSKNIFFSLAVENLMRYEVKNATFLRICLYFLILSSTEQ